MHSAQVGLSFLPNMETLVLSATYEPVARVPWQRAISLLWTGKVEVIEEYEDRMVRSVTYEFPMPSVIRFLRAIRGTKRAIKFSRENVYARDSGKCQYCRQRVPRHEATYDHVVPRIQGGPTTWDNVVICCVPCNQRKGGRTPEQARMVLANRPVKPKKLPETLRLTFLYEKGMPESWKSWLRDVAYWHGSLDED
jgi:5-methylcytosine-specific restriction endonuclease McrA